MFFARILPNDQTLQIGDLGHLRTIPAPTIILLYHSRRVVSFIFSLFLFSFVSYDSCILSVAILYCP